MEKNEITQTKPRELSSMHVGPQTFESVVKEVEEGSLGEAIAGIGALVLGILGVVGVLPAALGPIATICAGAAFLIGGGFLATESAKLFSRAKPERRQRELNSEAGLQILAGAAGIVLGILSLLRFSPIVLMAVSAIVFGSALIMTSAALSRLEAIVTVEPGARTQLVKGSDVFIGLGTIVLGILALTGVDPRMLAMVAVLSIGAGIVLSGSWLASRVYSLVER